jgi:hypothetical protein
MTTSRGPGANDSPPSARAARPTCRERLVKHPPSLTVGSAADAPFGRLADGWRRDPLIFQARATWPQVRDLDAVTEGLTSRWNSGPVEGRVNHIKMIKRQTFGRADCRYSEKQVLSAAHHPWPACRSRIRHEIWVRSSSPR